MTFLNFISRYLDVIPDSAREQFIEDIEDVIAFSIRQAFAANNPRSGK
jgi:hypothetical protein